MSKLYEEICKAANEERIVVGCNIFGYEDALEVVRAGAQCGKPALLMINRDASKALPVEAWGALLGAITQTAKVTVGIHLDHCSDIALIFRAIDSGFTSVMYDGSMLPLEENIVNTKKVVDYAHQRGVIVEAELGSVPYTDSNDLKIVYTCPQEAEKLVGETGVDMLAVSVGNMHRLTQQNVRIDFERLQAIQDAVEVPLVIHGASGIVSEDLQKLRSYRIGKINFGTVLRMALGNELRRQFLSMPEEFDRLKLMKQPREAVYQKALELINQ